MQQNTTKPGGSPTLHPSATPVAGIATGQTVLKNTPKIPIPSSSSSSSVPRSTTQASDHHQSHSPELVESTLFLLQETLWNTLLQMRNRESVYDCYSAAKSRHQTQYTCLLHIDSIFKILMAYPAEVLSAMYIPVILRYFKWCFSVEQDPRGTRSNRFIVTTKRGIAFLTANWNEYGYNTATLYQAFKALKLLQDIEVSLFPHKPAIYTNHSDDEAKNPNWTPLDDTQLESLVVSSNKNPSTVAALPLMAPEYLNQPNTGVPEYLPLDLSNQSPSVPVAPLQPTSHQFYGVHQSPFPSSLSEFQEPFVVPPQPSNLEADQQQRLDQLFSHTLPDISQKLHALGAANDDLRRQNNILSESLRNLRYQFMLLKNSTESALPKTPSPPSPKMELSQFQESVAGNIALGGSEPMESTDLSGVGHATKLELDVPSRTTAPYDAGLPYDSTTTAFRFDPGLKVNEPIAADESVTVFGAEGKSQTSPLQHSAPLMMAHLSAGSNASSSGKLAIKKPRNKFREFMGATLTKGETYQPPVTPEGKHYYLDEDGKLAIVMANDQDSIYGMYNEYYQSLRPQIDAFVNDFGKRNLVHFRKKRTFQKKKAFVQWVERISYAKGLSPETVLGMIDEVRHLEKRSVVWSCNNLSSMKEAFVKHKPDFRDIAMSDTD
ncbi:LAFA_0E05798g1_1 [Lachancea sp. 'fantastica']|nr:LAFA_0E05798g1_1 [Lachancea sp. 'fantastica']